MAKNKQKQEQGKAVSRPAGQRYCPKCRSEYQDWVKFCIDCGAELTDDLPIVPEHSVKSITMTNQEPDLVVICTVQGELAANVIKSHLESEGIPVLLKSTSYTASFGTAVGIDCGPISVLVPRKLADDARLIINPKESGELEESMTLCPQCGAAIANKTDFCDKCGAKVPINEFINRKNTGLNCRQCGTIMTIKDKHQKMNIFGRNKDYYICPECGKKTVAPED